MKSNPVKTLLTISMGFLGLFLAFDLSWAIWVALGVGVIGLFSDFLSAKIEYLWMKLAHVMGMIVPPVLLAAIFFLFLFPISLLSKLFGKKDPMLLSNRLSSTFTNVDKSFAKESFRKPW